MEMEASISSSDMVVASSVSVLSLLLVEAHADIVDVGLKSASLDRGRQRVGDVLVDCLCFVAVALRARFLSSCT